MFRRCEVLMLVLAGLFLLAAGAYTVPRGAPGAELTVLTGREAEPEDEFIIPSGPVDINSADVHELDQLPGIGEVLAGRIIEYRTEHGPFSSLEELCNVSGIGEKTCESLRGLVSFGEESK